MKAAENSHSPPPPRSSVIIKWKMLFSWLSSQRQGGLSPVYSRYQIVDKKCFFHVLTHGRCVNELDGEPLHAWQCKYLTSCERHEQPGRSIQLNLWRFCHPPLRNEFFMPPRSLCWWVFCLLLAINQLASRVRLIYAFRLRNYRRFKSHKANTFIFHQPFLFSILIASHL